MESPRIGRTEQFAEVCLDADQREGRIVTALIDGQDAGRLTASVAPSVLAAPFDDHAQTFGAARRGRRERGRAPDHPQRRRVDAAGPRPAAQRQTGELS